MYLLQEHKKEMEELQLQLSRMEKELDDSNNETSDNSGNEEANDTEETGINTSFQKIDGKFKKVLDNLTRRMWQAMQSSDPAAVVVLQQYLKTNRSSWENARDHHGCTIMHHIVQNGNHSLMETLLNAGVNPNIKERRGATPLTLAVLNGDEKMVKLLIDNFAICEDNFFSSVPAPKAIASKLGYDNIVTMIENCLESDNQTDLKVWEATAHSGIDPLIINEEKCVEIGEANIYARDLKNCKTLFVGDQGTNKIIRSCKDKSRCAYGWAAEVPGDMHCRGTV